MDRSSGNEPPFEAAFYFSGVCMSETNAALARASTEERFKAGERRFSRLEQRMDRLEQQMDANNHAVLEHLRQQDARTEGMASGIDELLAILKMAKTGVGFFAAIGRVLRRIVVWFGPFIAAAAAVWGVIHGKWPGQS